MNVKWGVLSTPCIDLDAKKLYVVAWTSKDGSVAAAVHELKEVDITTGAITNSLLIQANAASQTAPGKTPVKLTSSKQKQRSSLLLTSPTFNGQVRKTLFIPFAMTHEDGDPTHGWLVAVDLKDFKITAAWCASPNGTGVGIWQAGQGPAADQNNAIYLMTGNYGVEDQHGNAIAPAAGDLPESLIKLEYTLSNNGTGKLAPVAESSSNPGVRQLAPALGTAGTIAERLLPVPCSVPWSWSAAVGARLAASSASAAS